MQPAATAVAVRDGRIVALGDARSVQRVAGPRAVRVDCRGATVLPGLIDPHLHLYAMAARHAHLDARGVAGVADLLAAVARQARQLPPGAWVRGDGVDETRLGRLPSPEELDAAAAGRPVRLRHRSLHASLLGRTALARLPRGVRAAAPDGLVAGREAELSRVVGPLPRGEMAAALALVGRELAAVGLTTVADATPRGVRGLAPLRDVVAAGRFAPRVVAMRPRAGAGWSGSDRLAPGPVKLLVDEIGATLRPGAASLAHRITTAACAGAQVAVHCTTAAMLVAALAGFAAVPSRVRGRRRHRIEHCGECPPPLVASIARLGLTVVTNPALLHARGDAWCAEHAHGAWPWLYRVRSLQAAGIAVAAGSDAPVVPADPWRSVATARARRTRGGRTLAPAERVGAAAALALVSVAAARAMERDDLGRLAVGAPADLVVVEPDPLRASPDEVATTRVRYTIADGAVVWEA